MMESDSLFYAHDYLTRNIIQLKINKQILSCFHVQLMDVECVESLGGENVVLISILVYFSTPRG
jgi:hypothetical protein